MDLEVLRSSLQYVRTEDLPDIQVELKDHNVAEMLMGLKALLNLSNFDYVQVHRFGIPLVRMRSEAEFDTGMSACVDINDYHERLKSDEMIDTAFWLGVIITSLTAVVSLI